MVTNWPGIATEITPPRPHMSLESLVSAGRPPTRTFGLPGVHVPAGTGTHGIGIGDMLHTPNGGMFTIGATSPMWAAGPPHIGRPTGNTLSVDGAAPPVHIRTPPAQTCNPMWLSFLDEEL
jgi:hypothetical protein